MLVEKQFSGIIGASNKIREVFQLIKSIAPLTTSVLILGETGTGKELVARAIHENSPRKFKSFLKVDCASLPENLLESELFGYKKGAFTDARTNKPGKFEMADQGTLFIDEIGEMPLDTQVRLLRVIQTKEFERIGGTRSIKSDFRLIVATNRNIEKEVRQGRFRSDLFYRLNTFPILVPPLREREDDIPLLAHHFLKLYSQKINKAFSSFPENEMAKLMEYDWPGNIRELEHVIERGTIVSQGTIFRVPELAPAPTYSGTHSRSAALASDASLEEMERYHILQTLEKTRWKIRGADGAAERLGLHPSTLYSKMKKLGVRKPS